MSATGWAAAMLVGLFCVACSASPEDENANARLSEAVSATLSAKTAKFHLVVTNRATKQSDAEAKGAFDFVSRRGDWSVLVQPDDPVTGSAAGSRKGAESVGTGTGSSAQPTKDSKTTIEGDEQQAKGRTLQIGPVFYTKVRPEMPTWYRIPRRLLTALAQTPLYELRNPDLLALLAYPKAATGEVSVREEPAGNVRSILDATVPLSRLPEVVPSDLTENYEALADVSKTESLRLVVSTDIRNRVVEMLYSLTADGSPVDSSEANLAPDGFDVRLKLTEFGVPVDAEAPAGEKVVDLERSAEVIGRTQQK